MKAKTLLANRTETNTEIETFFMRFALAVMLILAVTIAAAAQSEQNASSNGTAKDNLGPSADSIRPYKPAGRDPFKKVVKPPPGKSPKTPKALGFPSLDARRAEFKQKVDMARTRGVAEPDPVQQYLISELDITGIFRDEHGEGAFVRAQPTGTMFFVRRGAACYNGEIVRIETDGAETGGAKVLFREVSYLEVNGKQSLQERVVAKMPTASQAQK